MFYKGLRLWGVRFYKFYEGLRLWDARFVVFYEGLGLWEARLVVFYEGLRLWEAHLYVFYVSGRLSGGPTSNHPMSAGGSAKERPSRALGGGGGGVGSWDHMNSKGSGRLDLLCFTEV